MLRSRSGLSGTSRLSAYLDPSSEETSGWTWWCDRDMTCRRCTRQLQASAPGPRLTSKCKSVTSPPCHRTAP
eukprot:639154-Rhodomonas_salina.1